MALPRFALVAQVPSGSVPLTLGGLDIQERPLIFTELKWGRDGIEPSTSGFGQMLLKPRLTN
jgi:hypothetical protein